MEEKREFKSGVTSTKQPRLSLIPHNGLVNAAIRFELGLEKHGEKAWNNLSVDQKALKDREWLIERCSHGIEHLYTLIDKLKTGQSLEKLKEDAGAVAWCGLVLGEAAGMIEESPEPTKVFDCPFCGLYSSSNLDWYNKHTALCTSKPLMQANQPPQQFKCLHCTYIGQSMAETRQHLLKVHDYKDILTGS